MGTFIVQRDYLLRIFKDGQLVDYIYSNTLKGCLEYFCVWSAPSHFSSTETSELTFTITRNLYGNSQQTLAMDL